MADRPRPLPTVARFVVATVAAALAIAGVVVALALVLAVIS